jgi:ankyrin repeat protein
MKLNVVISSYIIFNFLDILLENGCDIELTDYKGNNALHYACLQSRTQVANLLLQKVPAFATFISQQNHEGQT